MSSTFRLLTAALFLLLLPALAGAAPSVLARGADGKPSILAGEGLGKIDTWQRSGQAFDAAARGAVEGILAREFGATGNERMQVTGIESDEVGAVHVRFRQQLNGLPVAGAGMVLHARADGEVVGLNGEFVSAKDVPVAPRLDAETAITLAKIGGRRLTEPGLTYVIGFDGKAHLAWEVKVAYRGWQGPQRDTVFADAVTGELVARHPEIHSALSLDTMDCKNRKNRCRTVSTSSSTIDTGDAAIDAAHNYAIATYNYYFDNHGRDSIDDNGMTLVSRVHFDRNYNNAYWDGSQMTYGDGDGVNFIPLSQDADVVAHELTHGVTERTSGLVYASEAGAINEALSDIFGALVDVQEGATGNAIWFIGEDIYTPGNPNDALRYMNNPTTDGYSTDYYPERLYAGSCSPSNNNDYCGVHGNSGIANLAFQLLVDGGTHPRGKTSVNVNGIGFSAAADIFYAANTGCLTPNSDFAALRYCTADVFGGSHASAVHDAWDAVGVSNDPPPPPAEPIVLADATPLGNQDAETGNLQQYTLDVGAQKAVTCETSCNNGDADLYLRFGAEAEANPNSTNNECGSYSATSNESCTTGASSGATTLFAGVHAYDGFTNLTITCTSSDAQSCDPAGSPCGNCCNGCSGGKPSTRVCL